MDNIDLITQSLHDGKTPDELPQVFASTDAALLQKVQDLLGPDGLAQYEDYTKNLGSSLTVQQFKSSLTGDDAAVAAKTAQLTQLMEQQTQSALANAGLPADYPNDISFRTTTTGIEFARIPIPCRAERYTATGGPDTWWPTPEPPHRINQIFLEPVLVGHAAAMPGVTLLNRTRVVGFGNLLCLYGGLRRGALGNPPWDWRAYDG